MATENLTTPIPSRRAAIAAGVGVAGALARWQAAHARYSAVLARFCPLELRVRPSDHDRLKRLVTSLDPDDNSRLRTAEVYGDAAIRELRGRKKNGTLFWPARPGDPPSRVKARARAEEILAAAAHQDTAAAADGAIVDAALDDSQFEEREIREEVLCFPASAKALALKLRIFADCWRVDRGHDAAGFAEFEADEAPATYLAGAIALDLLALVRRAQSGDEDRDAGAFRLLAEVASAIGVRLVAEARA
jgi:hypothetical protein